MLRAWQKRDQFQHNAERRRIAAALERDNDLAERYQVLSRDLDALGASMLQQNRLYARLALQKDASNLARVLGSFEPLLEQLDREDLSPMEADRLLD